MDKKVLKQWITAGFIYKNQWSPTEEGAPQGGPASAALANQALDGIEHLVKTIAKQPDKANFIRYADDFIITGASKDFLENIIKPEIKTFLAKRGLTLSDEKTHITHIDDGFNFLGFNIRKYKGKLLIKPSKEKVKMFLTNIREIIKKQNGAATINLLRILNPKIRGWGNYYSHAVSKDTFSYVDHEIFVSIWKWCKRRHPNKGHRWIKKKYFETRDNQNWVFAAKYKNAKQKWLEMSLITTAHIPIVRHVKIKADATPYSSKYQDYFEERQKKKKKANQVKPFLQASIYCNTSQQQLGSQKSFIKA